jgi:hypothetical protein
MPHQEGHHNWEYCKLTGRTIYWLAAHGLFADKSDDYNDEAKAWDRLSRDGWELVSVVAGKDGVITSYFKRPRAAD